MVGGPIGLALMAIVAVLGLGIVVAGAMGWMPTIRLEAGGSTTRSDNDLFDYAPLRLGLAVAAAAAALLVTGWPVAAVYAAAAGFILPTLVLAKRRRKAAIARLEAIAVWIESLRDTMAASAGLQQALQQSMSIAPLPIRREVRDLVVRLQHQSTTESLRRFATDMSHPLADMVVASLILATTRHAGSLQPVLATTAKAARDTAAMWRQVESDRTRMYSQAKMAGWVTFAMMLGIVLLRRPMLDPYDSLTGQIVLAVILGVFVGACYGIYHLGRPMEPRRVFDNLESWSDLEGRVLR